VILSIDTANRPDLDADFVKKIGAAFPIALDDSKLSRELFRIQGTPTNFVIDRSGKIVFRHLGFFPGAEKVLDAEILSLTQNGQGTAT
jgi:hypothetical protein